MAKLSIGHLAPLGLEAWLGRSISSSGQFFADGAEFRLYGTEQTRTLEIVATAPPGQIPEVTDLILDISDLQSLEATEQTTGCTPK